MVSFNIFLCVWKGLFIFCYFIDVEKMQSVFFALRFADWEKNASLNASGNIVFHYVKTILYFTELWLHWFAFICQQSDLVVGVTSTDFCPKSRLPRKSFLWYCFLDPFKISFKHTMIICTAVVAMLNCVWKIRDERCPHEVDCKSVHVFLKNSDCRWKITPLQSFDKKKKMKLISHSFIANIFVCWIWWL